MDAQAPQPLHVEHQELGHFLAKAVREAGELGEAARLVARLLEAHMEKEETFALPPLALLPALARGKFKPEMAEILAQTDYVKAHLSDLLAEHHAILAALERLIAAARAANRFEYVEFAEKLINHARLEEEVLYPAAIVLGEYVRLKLEATLELNP
ncbi:MAG TPA: hemerythrin domain-containing protein [Burkholderiales bacterium]|jgi:hypothetical protein|nr:hemerythrin domain-containing protein [Burkholderiales bacterium]